MTEQLRPPDRKPAIIFLFRILGILALAAICVTVPAVGDNRMLLAALLVFVVAPLDLWMEIRFPTEETLWTQPLMDLLAVLTLVHLVPHLWHAVLVLGLMIALAPSVTESPRSWLYYSLFGALLLPGMALAAWWHDVDNWALPLAVAAAVYPSVIFYAFWTARRADHLRNRALALSQLNQVAGGLAHDFNNLLAGIMGHAELAQQDLADDHPARRPINSVINGASQAGELSTQLLRFSGRGMSRQNEVDLIVEVRVLASLLRPALARGVNINVVSDETSLHVTGNQSELQLLLMNLILNAANAPANPGGELTVTVERRDGHAELVVSGAVANAQESRLPGALSALFSSQESDQRLGFANSRRIAQRYGGELRLQHRGAPGTSAHLTLPLADNCPTQTKEAP